MTERCEFIAGSGSEDFLEKINNLAKNGYRVNFINFRRENALMERGTESWLYKIINGSSENFMVEINHHIREGFTIRDVLLEGTRTLLMERKIL